VRKRFDKKQTVGYEKIRNGFFVSIILKKILSVKDWKKKS